MEAHQFVGKVAIPAAREPAATAVARRLLDVALAGVLLLVIAPLMLLIALLVRLDSSGSSFFRQRRIGRDGRAFDVHKFRTMRENCDATPHREYVQELIGGTAHAVERTGGEALYKLTADDRVTRVGRVLRQWSLDELPQLWDVLRGEMSLVGPRPVVAYELDLYPTWWFRRFAVKPGLTGLWQVSGRNERTYEEMIRLDVEYVQRRTIRLDLWILVRTVWVVVSRKGAA